MEKRCHHILERETETNERSVGDKMQELHVILAKYYLPNELFVGQVEEVIDMLIDRLAKRFPQNQAVTKANHIVAKYYLSIPEA